MGNEHAVQDIVAFMKTLTDDRVKHKKAPFDHPALFLPNGTNLEAVGANGGEAIKPFIEVLNAGGLQD